MKYVKEIILFAGLFQLFLESPTALPVFISSLTLYLSVTALEMWNDHLKRAETANHIKAEFNALKAEFISLSKTVQTDQKTIWDSLETTMSAVGTIQDKIISVEKAQTSVKTMAEESKKMISQANLGMGFRATKREA